MVEVVGGDVALDEDDGGKGEGEGECEEGVDE